MFTTCLNIQRLCILPILWLDTCHSTVAIKSCYYCNTVTWHTASLTACCSAICEKRQNSVTTSEQPQHVACVGKTPPPHQRPFRRNTNTIEPHGTVQLYEKRKAFKELSDFCAERLKHCQPFPYQFPPKIFRERSVVLRFQDGCVLVFKAQ
jgi:hypothetical protein